MVLLALIPLVAAARQLTIVLEALIYGAAFYYAIRSILSLVDWFFDRFYVTSSRVIDTVGIVGRSMQSIPIRSITSIGLDQTTFQRIFGTGTVKIESSGFRGYIALRDVYRPMALVREMTRVQERLQSRAPQNVPGQEAPQAIRIEVAQAPGPTPSGPDAGTEVPTHEGAGSRTADLSYLERLAELHARGMLTDDEYTKAKAAYLDR